MFRKLVTGRLTRGTQSEIDGDRRTAVPAQNARSGVDGSPDGLAALEPTAPPDYFGGVPHFANSPLPMLDLAGTVVTGTGMRKFVTALPGLGTARQNELGSYLPVAVPDTITYPGCDYYEIGVQQYAQQLHKDLQATRLRGYRQLNNGTDASGHNTVAPPSRPYYLGPMIVAQRDRPVRVKFINQLPTDAGGDLFLPVDPTVVGAGPGPLGGTETYPQNRAAPHLRGAVTPWISAGGPDQWLTPANQDGPYRTGATLANVPDMPAPNDGAVTLFYPNQQSARLLWFHDNTLGISRLTTYSGQIGLYLLQDPVEQRLVADEVLPAEQIPLIIQDKTFVPGDSQLAAQDPTWDRANWGSRGSLWFPHVYLPNQNPDHSSGANPMGRWDYGPWFWPPCDGTTHGPTPNPYHDPVTAPAQPPLAPGTPTPSAVPEALLDTPLVNGTAYPYLQVRPQAYRFRILNACNDRALNLQLYHAAADAPMWNPEGSLNDGAAGEVPMVPAAPTPGFPPNWPTDGRPGGVPDPASAGPAMIQIGNDGGLLPAPVVLPNQPVDYVYNRRDATTLNLSAYTLLLGPGERADVIIDFSSVPPGSNLILYNDCPAPIPAFDPRYDYYTGGPDQTPAGGTPTTQPGYGPNTRTLLQFRVAGSPAAPFDLAALRIRLPLAYGESQPPPIVPQPAYDTAFETTTGRNTHVPIQATSVTFTPHDGAGPLTLPLERKAISERFERGYGRASVHLGVEPDRAGTAAREAIALSYIDPATEALLPADPTALVDPPGLINGPAFTETNTGTQLWKITHNGTNTNFVHFDYVAVQLINRVGRNGAIRPPDPNELGWKQSVRVNPLEDCVVAVRPVLPDPLPFKIGDSIRPLHPSLAPGSVNPFSQIDPRDGEPTVVTNKVTNFGWEYAWRCRLFAPAENDVSRPLVLRVSPAPPSGLTATAAPGAATVLPGIVLEWTGNDGRPAATGRLLQRATDAGFTTGLTEIRLGSGAGSYTDSNVTPGVSYHYRIRAENPVSFSAWSHPVSAVVRLLAPGGLTATVPAAAPLRVSLAWTNRSFATGVEVQRATNPTFTAGTLTRSVPAAGNFLDATVSAETTYYYRVRTTYLGATSPWSNVATEITPGRPASPTELAATLPGGDDGETATVNLSWRQEPGAVVGEYILHRATDARFATGLVTTVIPGTVRKYSCTGLTGGITYYFRLHTVNAAGASAVTNPVSATTIE